LSASAFALGGAMVSNTALLGARLAMLPVTTVLRIMK
jgi:hypothetical protein